MNARQREYTMKDGGRSMKRGLCVIMAAVLALLAVGCAFADQTVTLPESSYRLTLPDEMEYDGPGTGNDDAKFAYVFVDKKLEIDFFLRTNPGGATLQAIAEVLRAQNDSTAIYRIRGIDMIVYRVTDPGDDPTGKGMKCIGYAFLDGDYIQEICFWYGTQEAADLTEEIISSITKD